jgi:hypothetical protein
MSLPTQQVLTIYGIGSDGKPAEGVHVDVCVGLTCAGIGPRGSLANQPLVDSSQFLKVNATVSGQMQPSCVQISDWQLHCILGVDGSAKFTATSISAVNSNVAATITIVSGKHAMPVQAQLFIGRPLSSDAQLVIPPISPGTLVDSAEPPCSGSQPASCSQLTRVSTATVQIVASQGSSGAAGASGSPVFGSAVDVHVSIAPTQGGTSAGLAWLSGNNMCAGSGHPTQLILLTDPSRGSANFFVCTDGHGGTYSLSAFAGGVIAPVTTEKPTTFVVDPAPARITAVAGDCSQGDAGSPGNLSIQVQDCDGAALSNPIVSWNVDGSPAQMLPPPGQNGFACVSAAATDQSTAPDGGASSVRLDFSTCRGFLLVGGK